MSTQTSTQILKVLKGAAVAGAGALLTVALDGLTAIDYVITYHGVTYDYTAAAVAVFSVLANIIRKVMFKQAN